MALAVARTGSIAAAARTLKIDATTVSRRLRALSDQLGLRLFERHAQGLRPTTAGREVVAAAERMEAESLRLERAASGADQRVEGLVRITTIESLAAAFLSGQLAPLIARYPGLHIELVTGDQKLDLTRSEADLAIRTANSHQEGIVARKLGTLGAGIYASRGYLERHRRPAKLEDLAEHECLGFSAGLQWTPEFRFIEDLRCKRPFVFGTNSTLSLLAAVRAGAGVAMVPCYLASPYPELVQLFGPDLVPRRELSLVMHKELRQVRRIRVVADHLVQVFHEHEALLSDGVTPSQAAG